MFVTSAMQVVEVWDSNKYEMLFVLSLIYFSTKPTTTFEWGHDTVSCVKWNPSEDYIIASTASDRSICLYDIRAKTPIRKVILKVRHQFCLSKCCR
jgi:WD repeat and SOF domain-containing protein 1